MLRHPKAAAAAAAAVTTIILAPAVSTSAYADTTTVGTQSVAGPDQNIPSEPTCTDRVLYHPFTEFGDDNAYYLMSGGDFESPYTDWTGTAATFSNVNEPWQVGGADDSRSAQIRQTGGTLSAPTLCVKADEPTFRFFYKAPGVNGSKLSVKVRTTSSAGTTTRTVSVDGTVAGWHLSDPINLPNNIDGTGTQRLTIDFSSNGGAWNIDDVYVDPWKYNLD